MDIGSLFSLEKGPVKAEGRAFPQGGASEDGPRFDDVFDDGAAQGATEGEGAASPAGSDVGREGVSAQEGAGRREGSDRQEPAAADAAASDVGFPENSEVLASASAKVNAIETGAALIDPVAVADGGFAVGGQASDAGASIEGETVAALSAEAKSPIGGGVDEQAKVADLKGASISAGQPVPQERTQRDGQGEGAAPSREARDLKAANGQSSSQNSGGFSAAASLDKIEKTASAEAASETAALDASGEDASSGAEPSDKAGPDRSERAEAKAAGVVVSAAPKGAPAHENAAVTFEGETSAAAPAAAAQEGVKASFEASTNAAPEAGFDDAAPGPERRDSRSADRAGSEARLGPAPADNAARNTAGGDTNGGQLAGGDTSASGAAISAATGAAEGAGFDEAMLEAAPAQPGAVASTAARVDAVGAAQQATAAARSAAVADQIGAAVLARGDDRRIVLQLDPQELGRVAIELTFADDALSVSVRAERPEALELMRRSADDLARQLRDAGLDFDSLSFGAEGGRGEGFNEDESASAARDGFAYRGDARLSAEDSAPLLQPNSHLTRPGQGWSGGVDLRV